MRVARRHNGDAEIPCGKWSGNGSFVAYGRSDKAAEGTPPDILDHGTYDTHLTISQSAFEGQPTTRLEILSPRGEYEHMEGDRTHLVAHLWRDATLDDDTLALYRLIALGMSFDDKEPHLEKAEPNKRQYATCLKHRRRPCPVRALPRGLRRYVPLPRR